LNESGCFYWISSVPRAHDATSDRVDDASPEGGNDDERDDERRTKLNIGATTSM
jgi:hypothetical protein